MMSNPINSSSNSFSLDLKNERSYYFRKRILDLILGNQKTCLLDLMVGKFVEFLILDYLQVSENFRSKK